MNSPAVPSSLRRSSRVPFTLPILVTSLEPSVHFSEVCETLVVNAHGCAVRSPMRLEAGVPLHFHSKDGRQTTAHVVDCQPLEANRKSWRVGARLDQPENFWDLKPCPQDWASSPYSSQGGNGKAHFVHDHSESPLTVVPSRNSDQLSDDRVRTLIAEIVHPLHVEVMELRERLARPEGKRSSFEVSLGQIPPELEEQLWLRLRENLGAQAMQLANEQSERVLVSTRLEIERRVTEATAEFLQAVKQELTLVEERGRRLSDEIDDGVRQQLRAGLEQFQQHSFQAGAHLERKSEEFLRSLQQRLTEEHEARLQEVQQVHSAVAAESARQQAMVADLGSRVGKLDDSTRRMEADFDSRLTRISTDVLSATRGQLEKTADAILEELVTRNSQELAAQLDAACERLKILQKGIEVSVSELLRAQATETLQSFAQTAEQTAADAVGKWRLSLARDLSAVARTLGDQVRLEIVSGTSTR